MEAAESATGRGWDVLFYGDSIMEEWRWATHIAPLSYKTISQLHHPSPWFTLITLITNQQRWKNHRQRSTWKKGKGEMQGKAGVRPTSRLERAGQPI